MSNEDYYDNDNDNEAEEKFSGFSILDESGIEISQIKKIVKKIEEESEETIATPVPENEQTVIIENVAFCLPSAGQELDLNLSEGAVYLKNERVGTFKPAFIKRLRDTRAGQFAKCFLYSSEQPIMVKLVFNKNKAGVLIEPNEP